MIGIWKRILLSLSLLVAPAVGYASIAVSVAPQYPQVKPGGQVQFTATVSGTSNDVVVWSLSGASCTGTGCGRIDDSGLYTAPSTVSTALVVIVKATSVADVQAYGTAQAYVSNALTVSVSVAPATATVLTGAQQRFSAFVTGTANTAVTWSLAGNNCSQGACGDITSDGLYIAPAQVPTPSKVTVTATSVADPTRSGTAVVTVAPPVAVSVSPANSQVVAGTTQQFTATVTGTTDLGVTWSLSGVGCQQNACGTISSSGLYTAPSTVPNPAQVNVTATSQADPTKSSTVILTVIPPIVVTVSPTTASVRAGNTQQFTAAVTGTTNTGVTWSVSGSGCAASSCGTISSTGLYKAPASVPAAGPVNVVATSVANPAKSSTAVVTVLPPIVVTVSPTSASVVVGQQQQFTAQVTGTTNTAVTWSLSGLGCNGNTCGTITPDGLYTAPSALPNPATLTVTAVSDADSSKSASANVTLLPPVIVSVKPTTAQVVAGAQQQFTATVTGTTSIAVSWSLSGAGCSGATCGTITSTGLYTAPATVPSPAQVNVTATSVSDPSKSASASVTIVPPVVVSVSPTTAQVIEGNQQQFVATVTGTTKTGVTWQVLGSGCTGTACGTITAAGLYTAPAAVPNPSTVTVVATSVADPTKSAAAVVTILLPTTISISPAAASVIAGHQQQFTATITGAGSSSGVAWSVSGSGCSGSGCGTISSAGLYTAPSTVPNPATVTVTATSVADPSKTGTASVTVLSPVSVSVSPSSAKVVTGQTQQFTAMVTGTTNPTVVWTVTGAGCSGASCGTVTSLGLYTAPATVPTPAEVVVTATSQAQNSQSASATVTIVAPPVVTVSPSTVIIPITGQQQFTAFVSGATNTAVTWSVSGAGCTGASCGTITSTGLYTAPVTVPSPSTVQVSAASEADSAVLGTATVSLVSSNDGRLSGKYAFFFTGFDKLGVYEAVGSFTADGNGNIVSGEEDVNRTSGPEKELAIRGTYQIGPDDRGSFTINDSAGDHTFKLALGSLGDSGRFISFDDSEVHGSGVLKRQDPSAFKTSAISGAYVLSLAGQDVHAARLGAIGVFYPDGAGFISGGNLDVNDGGTVPPTFTTVNGTLSVEGSGRASVSLVIPGFAGGTFSYVAYIVSPNTLFLLSLDQLSADSPILGGTAELQALTRFTSASLTGQTIFSLSGGTSATSDVLVGSMDFDGKSQVTATYDENDGGTISLNGSLTGAYNIGLNGRGTLNLVPGNRTWTFYALGSESAVLLDQSTSSAGLGEITPELFTAPFVNSDLVGSYTLASGAPATSPAALYAGAGTFTITPDSRRNGQLAGEEDIDQDKELQVDQRVVGTYFFPGAEASAGATLTLTSPESANYALWVAGPDLVLGLDVDGSDTQPVLLYFEQ